MLSEVICHPRPYCYKNCIDGSSDIRTKTQMNGTSSADFNDLGFSLGDEIPDGESTCHMIYAVCTCLDFRSPIFVSNLCLKAQLYSLYRNHRNDDVIVSVADGSSNALNSPLITASATATATATANFVSNLTHSMNSCQVCQKKFDKETGACLEQI